MRKRINKVISRFNFGLKAILLLSFLFLPLSTIADMRSSNYIIRESVDYLYDGPVISSVSVGSPSSSGATVTWTTSAVADGYVVYSVNADPS